MSTKSKNSLLEIVPLRSSSNTSKKKSTSSFFICGNFSTRFVSFTNSSKVLREIQSSTANKEKAALRPSTLLSFFRRISFLIEAEYLRGVP